MPLGSPWSRLNAGWGMRSADHVWRHVADQLHTKFENKPPKRPESLYIVSEQPTDDEPIVAVKSMASSKEVIMTHNDDSERSIEFIQTKIKKIQDEAVAFMRQQRNWDVEVKRVPTPQFPPSIDIHFRWKRVDQKIAEEDKNAVHQFIGGIEAEFGLFLATECHEMHGILHYCLEVGPQG